MWGEMRGDIVGKGIWEGGKGEEEEGECKHQLRHVIATCEVKR